MNKYVTDSCKERVRNKITVAVPFLVYPAFTGGQLRVFNLYRNLSRWIDIELVTYTHPGKKAFKKEIAQGLWEIRVPKSIEHAKKDEEIIQKAKAPVSDIILCEHYELTQEYLDALKESATTSELVIACHPYIYPAVRKVTDKRVWYEAQDFEYELKELMLSESPLKQELLDKVKEVEQQCCKDSEIIMTCSYEDAIKISKLYNIDTSKFITVPNGADIELIGYVNLDERNEIKKSLGKGDEFIAVFVGSWHGPNLIAVNEIIKMAKKLKDITFIIIGNAGKAVESSVVPNNVAILGMIDDSEKNTILSYADIALNPMPYGSGTNLKMLEYFAFGIPVVTTPIGARGLKIEDEKHVIISAIEGFTEKISELKMYDKSKKQEMVLNANKFVVEHFSWSGIAERTINTILDRRLINSNISKRSIENLDNKFNDNRKLELGNIQHIISNIGERPVMIWGAGNAGKNTLKLLKKIGVNVSGFIDKDKGKWGKEIEGIHVYSQSILLDKNSFDKCPFIIIGSMYALEISNELEAMSYKSKVDYLEQDIDVPFLSLM